MSDDDRLTPAQIRAGQLAVEAITATLLAGTAGKAVELKGVHQEVLESGLTNHFISALIGFSCASFRHLAASVDRDVFELLSGIGVRYSAEETS